jgi:ParB family chromosome partitioning protein
MAEGKNKLLEETRHRGLGRGLSALIGDEAVPVRGEGASRKTPTLPVAFLRPNRFQPRKRFADDEIRDLAESIREKGVLQPILIRPIAGDPNAYEIIAGERRWRAAQLAKLHEVPVVIRDIGDAEALELAIVENVQRADLNAIEEAAAYHELMDRFGYTQEKISHEVGKSRSHVANTIRLLKLPESVKTMVRDGSLTAGHARALLGSSDPEARAREIITQSLNVRDTERRSEKVSTRRSKSAAADPNVLQLESSLSNMLGLKVHIVHKGSRGGELRISYKTLEQLDDLVHRLRGRG